jgi:hypothetical protein
VRAAGSGDLSSSCLGDDMGFSGVPVETRKTPMGVSDSGDPSWVVGSVRTTAQWRGDG